MLNIKNRWLENRLKQALDALPVVVITGMRQTGKTTLVKDLLAGNDRFYRTFDDLGVLAQGQRDPRSLLLDLPLTLDEVQRVPDILLSIKQVVDDSRKPGDFLLTGSANLLLHHTVAESLAGRAVYLELMPFCPMEYCRPDIGTEYIDRLFGETFQLADWPDTEAAWQTWVIVGGFVPSITAKSPEARDLWFSGYVQAYLERDLRDLSQVADLYDFQRVMRLCAFRSGRLINQAEIARDAALPQATGHRYLNLLEAGYHICRLPVYRINPAVSLIKAKKLFWADSGLAAWLSGINSSAQLKNRDDVGFWFEQAMFQTFRAWAGLSPGRRKLYYWRDRRGREVDLIIEQDERIVACEFKASSTPKPSDADGLSSFSEGLGIRRDRLVRSVVFHTGRESRTLNDSAIALSSGCFFPHHPLVV